MASGGPREQTIEQKLAYAQGTLRYLIMQQFPRSFRGYDRAAVDSHLELIVGWLSLSGLDDLVRERFNEQDPLARQLRAQAQSDAEQIREDACREADHRMDEGRDEADRRTEEVRDEARRVLKAAHQDAEAIRANARQQAEMLLAEARADAAAGRHDQLARFLSGDTPDS